MGDLVLFAAGTGPGSQHRGIHPSRARGWQELRGRKLQQDHPWARNSAERLDRDGRPPIH